MKFPLFLIILVTASLENDAIRTFPKARDSVAELLHQYDQQLLEYRHAGAQLAWNMSVEMTQEVLDENERFSIQRNIWSNEWCSTLMEDYSQNIPFSKPWTPNQLRQLYLICRGPRFTSYQLSNVLSYLAEMLRMYGKQVCIGGHCMRMEPDLNRVMESSRDERVLKETWTKWHQQIGEDVKPLYIPLIQMLNEGARQGGHSDMGDCWREETEISELKNVAVNLYEDVKPLLQQLHTFVRFKLEKFYKMKFQNGPIPAHLLGNMYAQNWQSLIDIVWEDDENETTEQMTEEKKENPLVKSLLPPNATVVEMVKSAEDFFVSMGLPKLPTSFWKNSWFEDQKDVNGKETSQRNCHGSAANMFGNQDYRIMMCATVKDDDYAIFQHELGHIMYFMAYSDLPLIFQDGANSAFHESVGDAVTYDLKPRSTKRKRPDMKSLLKTGLAKLPQIGYGLALDAWRWYVFENENDAANWNNRWWALNQRLLGVTAPEGYGIDTDSSGRLDAAGKFHVIDNVPYIRYYFAMFLQLQFYEAMCGAAGFEDMHLCQIRGSKEAGALLWKMMSRGSSKHWSLILEEMTGSREILSRPLLKYFQPLQEWLQKKIVKYNLTIGW